MKKLLPLLLFLVISLAARSQAIQFTASVPHTTGTPSGAPTGIGAWIRYDKTNKILYQWTGAAWTRVVGAVTDGDKGDITTSSSGTNWQLDASSVGNTEIASGAGGIYKGNGTIPGGTNADVASYFAFEYSGNELLEFYPEYNYVKIGHEDFGGENLYINSDTTYIILPASVSGFPTKVLGVNASGRILGYSLTNSIDSTHISNGTISPNDFAQRGASVGQVMTYTANGWRPATPSSLSDGDKGDITVSGSGATWNIDADAVGSGEIAADAVGASEIATGAVGAAEIAANAVGASELAATAVVAGSYTYSAITVDADGRLTSASNGTAPVVNGGNSFGTTMTIGTNDAQSLNLEVGGVIVAQFEGTRFANYGVSVSGTTAMGSTLFHNTEVSGTPGTGFGGAIEFSGESSTTNYIPAAKVGWQWTNATHASRTSELVFHTVNSGTMAERMSLAGSGTLETTRVTMQAGTATAGTAPLKFTSGTNLTTPEAGAIEFDGTNYYATSSTTRYTLAKTLTATASLNFPSVAASTCSDLTVTVTGAADGDDASVGVPNASILANGSYTWWASAANTVTVRFCNHQTVGALDPASGTFRATVLKY